MIHRQLKFNITTKELNIPLKIKKKSLFEKYRIYCDRKINIPIYLRFHLKFECTRNQSCKDLNTLLRKNQAVVPEVGNKKRWQKYE